MKNKIWIYLYYVVLILVLVSRQNASSAPPLLLRLGFFIAVVAPVLFTKNVCYPAIITIFYSLTSNGFAYSYMPYSLTLYVSITIFVVLIISRGKIRKTAPLFLFFMAFYLFFIDLFTGGGYKGVLLFERDFLCLVLTMLFIILVYNDKELSSNQLPICFAVITTVLSLLFLLNRDKFTIQYQYSGLERSGWVDPNYFGMILGMGTIVGLMQLFDKHWKKKGVGEKVLYIITIVVSVPTLLLNASRGAVLSVVVAFVLLLLFSKAKTGYKVLFIFVAAIGISYLYSNQYFELLEYRIENDEGTGSGRTEIWASKLSLYSGGNVAQLLFGYGYRGGMNITGIFKGFHNEYVGFLVEYGIVGLCFLLYLLLYPIKLSITKQKKDKSQVIVMMVYLATCMITLEPLGLGVLAFYSFYIYALLLAQSESVNEND